MSTKQLRKTAEANDFVGQSQAKMVWRQFKKNKGAVVGLIILIAIVVIAIAATFIWDYDTDITGMNTALRLKKPSLEHLFGTDHMGRSLLARVCFGTRYSLLIGFGAVIISTVFGVLLGAFAGYFAWTLGRQQKLSMSRAWRISALRSGSYCQNRC